MKIDLLPAEEPVPSRCVCNLNIAEKVSRLQVVFVYLPRYDAESVQQLSLQ